MTAETVLKQLRWNYYENSCGLIPTDAEIIESIKDETIFKWHGMGPMKVNLLRAYFDMPMLESKVMYQCPQCSARFDKPYRIREFKKTEITLKTSNYTIT